VFQARISRISPFDGRPRRAVLPVVRAAILAAKDPRCLLRFVLCPLPREVPLRFPATSTSPGSRPRRLAQRGRPFRSSPGDEGATGLPCRHRRIGPAPQPAPLAGGEHHPCGNPSAIHCWPPPVVGVTQAPLCPLVHVGVSSPCSQPAHLPPLVGRGLPLVQCRFGRFARVTGPCTGWPPLFASFSRRAASDTVHERGQPPCSLLGPRCALDG